MAATIAAISRISPPPIPKNVAWYGPLTGGSAHTETLSTTEDRNYGAFSGPPWSYGRK
jgi:hypothetical protein